MSMTTRGSTAIVGRKPKFAYHPEGATQLILVADIAGLAKGTSLAMLDDTAWEQWCRYLDRRKLLSPPGQILLARGVESLFWGLADDDDDGCDARDLLGQLQRRRVAGRSNEGNLGEIAELWLKEAPSRHPSPAFGLEALAWCYALPMLAAELPTRTWCQILDQLLSICHEATAVGSEQSPLAQQLLAGELPLALAWQFPEISQCAPLAKVARTVLSDGIMDLLDEGVPRSRHLPIARGLLACWTRSALVGQSLKHGCFRASAYDQFRNFARNAVCLSRPNGSQMLSQADGAAMELHDAALAVAGDASASASAEALFCGQHPPMNGKRRLLLPAAVHSEWAELAVLRANWSKNSPVLAVSYNDGQLASELVSQQRVIWSGRCDPQIQINGAPVEKIERWEEVCWFTDDDVHYVELEAELSGGWKTQRQFLLARTDAILLIADAIIGPVQSHVTYQCLWPTPNSLAFRPASETCEGTLQSGARRWANLLPLALPEWRSDGRRSGTLESSNGSVAYRLARQGQRMYVPLVVDLEPWRIKRELTWRSLTVGHNLVPQPSDVAVGYRVQLHKQHWLIYRSLAERASRTVLGQNIYSEFVCARFNRGGDAQTLIEIE